MTFETLAAGVGAAGHAVSVLLGVVAYATAAFTALFSLASVAAARRFRRLRARQPASSATPPVTLLKPIKGTDQGMYQNLASFLVQDYPAFQVLFALQNPDDPALPVLKRLRKDFPEADMEIIISKSRIGYNPKVNNLSNAYGFARHDLLVISDSDVRVERDFLRRVIEPLQDPRVGLVTCFYRATHASGAGAVLDALSVNAQFLPQAMTAAMLSGMRFAMGAVMAVRRPVFEAAGGLLALSEHLADDFLLGRCVTGAGYRIEVSSVVVDSIPDRCTVREQFSHLIRWSRTIRVCNPAGYLGSVLLHGFTFLCLYLPFAPEPRVPLACLAALAGVRALAVGWIHLAYLDNVEILRQLPLLPLSDLIQSAAWVTGLRSRSVLWRGESYLIAPGGRLVPEKQKVAAVPAAVA